MRQPAGRCTDFRRFVVPIVPMAAHVEAKQEAKNFKPLSEADIALTNRYSAGACTEACWQLVGQQCAGVAEGEPDTFSWVWLLCALWSTVFPPSPCCRPILQSNHTARQAGGVVGECMWCEAYDGGLPVHNCPRVICCRCRRRDSGDSQEGKHSKGMMSQARVADATVLLHPTTEMELLSSAQPGRSVCRLLPEQAVADPPAQRHTAVTSAGPPPAGARCGSDPRAGHGPGAALALGPRIRPAGHAGGAAAAGTAVGRGSVV